MAEGLRQATDFLEAHRRPKLHSCGIGRDDKVELHGMKATRFGLVQRVRAHRTRNALAPGGGRGHVTAIGNVGTWA